MKFLPLLLLSLFLSACSSGLVYKTAPAEQVNTRQAVRLSGVYQPYGLDFTALAEPKEGGVRLVVLSVMGGKLADLFVTPTEIAVYSKMPQLPARLVGGFGRMARAQLITPCPQKEFVYKDAPSRGALYVKTQGDLLCY